MNQSLYCMSQLVCKFFLAHASGRMAEDIHEAIDNKDQPRKRTKKARSEWLLSVFQYHVKPGYLDSILLHLCFQNMGHALSFCNEEPHKLWTGLVHELKHS